VVATLRDSGRLTTDGQALLEASSAPTAWKACVEAVGITKGEILEALSERFRLPIADLKDLDAGVRERIPEATARKLAIVPIREVGRTLHVALGDPSRAIELEQAIAFAAGMTVRLFLADPDDVRLCLDRLYPSVEGIFVGAGMQHGDGILRELSAWTGPSSPYSTSEIVDALIVQAVRRGASDVHLEPHEGSLGVRFRIDGVLYEVARMPRAMGPALASRIKVLANLDIADRIRPQDGRAQLRLAGRRVDLRISTLPVGGLGEKTVIRILDSGGTAHTLATLGFRAGELQRLDHLYRMSEGLVLVTGPTGSGKTTTLYAALRSVQTPGINIVTVEDPIEYRLEGVSQVQINERAGLTFASVLRSILRQDPDVVLVGEIRDRETAEVALQASMTGHLVLSTVHTNDAPSSIMRLVDLGVDLGTLASALKGVIAQRLLRRLCPSCRKPCDLGRLAAAQQRLLEHLDDLQLFLPGGCAECGGTGYRGRLVVPEVALITPALERAISQHAGPKEIAELCVAGGMRSLWEAGLDRVAAGETSLNELLDTVYPPMEDSAPPVMAETRDGRTGPPADAGGGVSQGASAAADDAADPGAPDGGGDAQGSLDAGAPPLAAPAAGSETDPLGQDDVDAVFLQFRSSPAAAPTTSPAAAGPATPAAAATMPGRGSVPSLRASRGAAGEGSAAAPRVLVIDDDATHRRSVRRALEADGFRVLEAATGDAGLEYLGRLKPDYLVLELTLPGVDGLEILRSLHGSADAPTAVVLTVNDDPDLAEWALELGAREVLVKPVEPRLLGARLRAIGDAAA
jgi:type IV pilus assembly protein PilB